MKKLVSILIIAIFLFPHFLPIIYVSAAEIPRLKMTVICSPSDAITLGESIEVAGKIKNEEGPADSLGTFLIFPSEKANPDEIRILGLSGGFTGAENYNDRVMFKNQGGLSQGSSASFILKIKPIKTGLFLIEDLIITGSVGQYGTTEKENKCSIQVNPQQSINPAPISTPTPTIPPTPNPSSSPITTITPAPIASDTLAPSPVSTIPPTPSLTPIITPTPAPVVNYTPAPPPAPTILPTPMPTSTPISTPNPTITPNPSPTPISNLSPAITPTPTNFADSSDSIIIPPFKAIPKAPSTSFFTQTPKEKGLIETIIEMPNPYTMSVKGVGTALGIVRGIKTGSVLAENVVKISGEATKALKGTRNPIVKEAIKIGQKEHNLYNPGPGYEKEFRFKNGLRADALNREQKIIRELKPENPIAIKRGYQQLENYIQQAYKEFGTLFRGILDTYKQK